MAYTQKKYTESDAVKKFREQMESHTTLKPVAYTSQWQPQIDQTVNDIINRKAFQYDVNADALYNQYKDRYVDLGRKAMMDTMGQAAQLTGGYGNSYAQMAGQQAYQGYLQGLTDKIPELAQLAEARYAQQGQDLYQKYGLLNTQEQNAYNSWLNNYNQWLTERDYLNNLYNTERGYDYGVYRDSVSDDQWKAQFDEDLRRYNKEHSKSKSGSGGGGGGSSPKKDTSNDTGDSSNLSFTQKLANLETAGATPSERSDFVDALVKDGTIAPSQAVGLKHIWAKK